MQQRIPRELLQEIQARTSLVEIIGQYVSLQKRGRSYVGLCPFHSEKSPSFHVDEARRMFYCFGCQAGGDVFAFLTQIENRPFPEVAKELAGRVGIVLPERPMTVEEKKTMDEREEMLFLYEVATSFYERQLLDARGAPAAAYLQKRQMPHEIVSSFRLGFAPDGWRNLADYLRAQRHNLYLAEKAGLIASRSAEQGASGYSQHAEHHYDRFRNRVMFPIRDAQGRVIAFGGRILEQGEPKYLNSPEHPLFSKSSALYGLDAARRAIGQEDGVLVVEGYFDCLGLHAAGITNVVATCGTSLTRSHLKVLRRYTRNIFLLYDGDRAGIAASERSLPLFLEEEMWPYFIGLPAGKDPDEVVAAEGTEGFKARIRRAIPLLEQLVLSRSAAALASAGAREEALTQLSGVLLKLKPEKLDFYINFIAQHFGMNPQLVGESIAGARERSRPSLEQTPSSLRPPVSRPVVDLPAAEEYLVHWLLRAPEDILQAVVEAEVAEFMLHEGLKQVVQWFVQAGAQGALPDVQALLAEVAEPGLRARLTALAFKELPITETERERACIQVILSIKERALKQFSARLTGEVNQLSRVEPDSPVLAQKSAELMMIKRELRALQSRISGRAG